MTELGPVARGLVAAARDGLAPDASAITRMRASIASATAGAAGGATAGASALVKLAAIAAIAVVVTAGFVAIISARSGAVPGIAPVVDDPTAAAATPTEHTRFTLVAHDVPPPPAPPHVPGPAPAPPSLAREIELLDRALAAIRASDPADALIVIREYRRVTADHGQMAEDAAAIELEARCETGAPWDALASRWPHAAQRPRVRAACQAR